jgi:hypothetical protein
MKKHSRILKWRLTYLAVLSLLILNSCAGVSADITVRPDGSGKIVLEYRVSAALEALGRFDGNQRWQTVPTGRADFERTLARLPDMRLVSFSSKEEMSSNGSGNIINRAELEFKNIEALPAFFGAPGKRAAFVRENGKNRLSFTLLDAGQGAGVDPDLLSLAREVSAGYELRLSFSAPETASLVTTPGGISAARIVSPGKKVSLAIETGELLGLSDGLQVEFIW